MENTKSAEAAGFEPPALSKSNLWSFSLGCVGRDMAYVLFNSFLLTFVLYTKGLTESQFAVLSGIIVAARIFDALNDPIMGMIVENTRSKFGRFKPWILIGAVTCSLVIFGMFSGGLYGWEFVVYFGIFYFLFSITFTMNDISYWGMIPSLAGRENDRNRLTSMTVLCASAGAAAVGALVPIFTVGGMAIGGNAGEAYIVVAAVTGAIFIACQTMTVLRVKEPKLAAAPPQKVSVKEMLSIIFKNDQVLWISLISLLYNVGNLVFSTVVNSVYIYFEFGYDGSLITVVGILGAAASVAVNVFFPKLNVKLTKRQLIRASMCCIAAGYALMIAVATLMTATTPAIASPKLWAVAFANGLILFGQSMFYIITMVTFANTVEYNEWKTGERRESIIFTLRPFMAKLGSALMQAVVSVIYIAAGVLTYTNKIADIEREAGLKLITDEQKAQGIKEVLNSVTSQNQDVLIICSCAVAAVLIAGAYILYQKKIKITEAFYKQMAKEIAEKKQAQPAAD
ncbi:MAG: glycoside-pentoside-hexuronide (GPH):cation symporter [Clostridiales bacterium]|jgi:melibiose permease/lactose/raffinose/galactose permease|nr:glycoside-pentoside-hexuronide (GPH):cation symporter [Clostridiales bacterium]